MARARAPRRTHRSATPRPGRAPAWLADVLVLASVHALYLALALPFLRDCYRSVIPGGWDGVAHYAIADLYSRDVFPALAGWMPEYFAGMPFPTFYPPLFPFLVALGAHLGLSTASACWIVLTASALAVPGLVYACARRLLRGLPAAPIGAGVAAVLAVGLMIDKGSPLFVGISLRSTFDVGLCSQALAFSLLLIAYRALLDVETARVARGGAAVALAGVLLSNVHVVWNAAFLCGAHAVEALLRAPVGQRARVLACYLAIAGAALALAAPWLLPMIAHLDYVPTRALAPPAPAQVVHVLMRLGVYVVVAGGVAWLRRDRLLVALVASLVITLAFGILPVPTFLGDTAIQPGRILVVFEFLAMIAVGYLVIVGAELVAWRHARALLALACVAWFASRWERVDHAVAKVTPEQQAAYEPVLRALEGRRDGRVLVEMGGAGSDGFALQALVGQTGAHSLTTVFRESALDVLFAVPLRNLLSHVREQYGVDSKLPPRRLPGAPPPPDAAAPTAPLAAPQITIDEANRARLALFNVRYVAARSVTLKRALAACGDCARITPPGTWELYALADARRGDGAGNAEVVPAPWLTFTRFSVKRRSDRGLDFVRLGEEAFLAARLDPVLALARDPRLDHNPEIARFAGALVVDYARSDDDAAFRALEAYSRAHALVLYEAPGDPLFVRLAALAEARPQVRVVRRAAGSDGRDAPALEIAALEARALLDAATAALAHVPVERGGDGDPPAAPRVIDVALRGEQATVRLDRAPGRPTAVRVKQGYFPTWRARSGEPVYLATPTFQLVFTDGPALELELRQGRAERLGALGGLFGLVLLVWLAARRPWT